MRITTVALATASFVGVLFVGTTGLHAGKAPNVQPGQWETTVTMEMPGMPMAMPPVKTSKCLTKKDLTPDTSQPGQNCKVLKQQFKGNDLEWSVKCTGQDGGTITMTGKGTYKTDTFTGNLEMDMSHGGQAMKMTASIASKRIGPCAKPAK